MRKTAFWLTTLLAILCLSLGISLAQQLPVSNVTIVVNRDSVNVRLIPALGAEVLGFVNAGYTAQVEARSPDGEWFRINFTGQQGWIGAAVVSIISGDINTVEVADPRTIPYGGFSSPRAGLTSATSPVTGVLSDSGLRVRAGPSRAYPVLANAPRRSVVPILGRTVDNTWLQVNFEGTLGWVAALYVDVQVDQNNLGALNQLPIDGIVAEQLPLSDPTRTDYLDTLRLLLARIDLAQPSLDAIRGTWTNIALGGRVACGNYPARPTNYNIANPILALDYDRLLSIQNDFNAAMDYLRQAIDLLIDACSRPQPAEGIVGQPVVQTALDAVNQADALFESLRRRLNELIPPKREPGPDECLFTYNEMEEIVKQLPVGEIRTGALDARTYVTGFCFDAEAGTSLQLELLKINGNILPLVSVSSFDNPSNFIAVGQLVSGQSNVSVAPILITTTGRYLVIISDLSTTPRSEPLNGEFALLLSNISGTSGGFGARLGIDPVTGQVVINPAAPLFSTPFPDVFNPIYVPQPQPGQPVASCPSITATCAQLLTCAEAIACLQAGNFSLDLDMDGIPCEENLCTIATPIPEITVNPVN